MIWKARLRGLESVIVKDTRWNDTWCFDCIAVMDYEWGCFPMYEIVESVFGMVLLLGNGE